MTPDFVRRFAWARRRSTSRLRSYLAWIRTSFVSRRTVSRLWETTSGAAWMMRARFSHLPAKSGMSVSIVVPGLCARMARTVWAQISLPPSGRSSRSTLVITACFTPINFTDRATRPGSNGSASNGRPVATLQKPQLRVQMLPRIMNVAVPSPQHSPMFGQCPLSQMV